MALGDLHNVSAPIAKATASDPTYTEGTVEGLSQDLSGRLRVVADLDASDLQIGAVEIKNGADDQRATVNTAGALLTAGTGTAGTAAAAVTTVQGIASMTPVVVQGVAAMTPLLVADQTVAITVSVTLTVGATYAANDFVGTSGSPISFANAVRTSGGSATLRAVTISDPAASAAAALELWLFNATITPPADSAAWDLSDAGGLLCVGIVSIPTTAQFLSSATGVLHVGNLGLQFHCAATTLFGALVTRGAPTYTGSLQVKLEIEYDQ